MAWLITHWKLCNGSHRAVRTDGLEFSAKSFDVQRYGGELAEALHHFDKALGYEHLKAAQGAPGAAARTALELLDFAVTTFEQAGLTREQQMTDQVVQRLRTLDSSA